MDSKKLDRIISIIREEMMTANLPGKGGGGGSQTDPKGTSGLVGFDPLIKFDGRSNVARRLPSLYRKDLIKKKRNNNNK